MHVLFVHPNYPAQFGHIARYLVALHGFRCTFVSEKAGGTDHGVERLQYAPAGHCPQETHYLARSFETQVRRSLGIYEALASRADIQPDLIVGHSGFASMLYLRDLYTCPIIGYFELFYHVYDSDLDFRHDLPEATAGERLRARTRNATLLLDLEHCDAGYAPTEWQRRQFPNSFQNRLTTIFDGIDTSVWYRRRNPIRQVGGWSIPKDTRIVTYVSRGLESMRGFDIFMRTAKRLCDRHADVVFVVVGEDRVAYGGDSRLTHGKTFKQWILEQDQYDLDRILFVGRLSADDLANLFSITDVHVYLTVPFVLSWSLMDALACGATVIASATAPVEEMVRDGENGILVDFFDIDCWVETIERILDSPGDFARLGHAAVEMIRESYSLEKCLPKMLQLYQRVVEAKSLEMETFGRASAGSGEPRSAQNSEGRNTNDH